MSEMQVFEDAQVAYEGYRDHTGGISLASGQAIPEWGALRPDIQAAWCASAHALREIMFCPPHWHMEHTVAMEPFAQCIACTREEVRELRQRRDFLFESNNRLVEERRAAEAQCAAGPGWELVEEIGGALGDMINCQSEGFDSPEAQQMACEDAEKRALAALALLAKARKDGGT